MGTPRGGYGVDTGRSRGDNQRMCPTERDSGADSWAAAPPPPTRESVLERAVMVLRAFDVRHPVLTVSDLSRRVGLPKSTVHRLVHEMARLGLLEITPDGMRLGMQLFELGELAPRSRDVREAARPYMEDLHEATSATVHRAVLDGVDVVYVDILRAKHGPRLPSRVGGRLPAHATGVGKAILAFSAPEVAAARVGAGLPALTRHTLAMPGAFHRALQSIRREGVAYDHEESSYGVYCAAAPVFGRGGMPVAALSVTGTTHRIDLPRLAPAVRTAAMAVTRRLQASA